MREIFGDCEEFGDKVKSYYVQIPIWLDGCSQ